MTDSTEHPIVTTAAGAVRGLWRDGSAAFLGIPFAEPPVGALRFAAPVPHRPWEGIRDAVEHGATPQRVALSEVTIIPEPSIPGDSTLNLDVFTPVPGDADAALPVLVWIHGGGYVAGSPASPWYDGASFNRDGVVTVNVSYRLGFDGFGWLEDAPLNRGVLDWILALEWVQANIAAFGGDPSRVTIAGQSAGGGAVLTLLSTPRADALFHGAYSVSGVPTSTSVEQAEQLARRIASLAGVVPSREGFATVSEERVLELQRLVSSVGDGPAGDGGAQADAGISQADASSTQGDGSAQPADPIAGLAAMLGDGLVLGPVVDGELIPFETLDAVREGVGSRHPLVLGTTDQEFNMVLAGAREQLASVPAGALLGQLGVEADVAAAYVEAHPLLDTAGTVGQYLTDRMFRAPALGVAEARIAAAARAAATAGTAASDTAAPVWLYRFSWASPVLGDAAHCLDVPFFFDCLDAPRVDAIAGSTPPQALADEVHGGALAFLRTGAPDWPSCDPDALPVRRFDVPSELVADGYADVRPLLPREVAVSH
ncbi:carboxylesterase/lipase family protein [Plantibacter sp. YIM 135249]|uniref:carboxylesterase/lipase family protein n=1 Tax=Plantibacter sp. YIM 135249 TaxID=3423918 RepID=UPI003D33FCA6